MVYQRVRVCTSGLRNLPLNVSLASSLSDVTDLMNLNTFLPSSKLSAQSKSSARRLMTRNKAIGKLCLLVASICLN